MSSTPKANKKGGTCREELRAQIAGFRQQWFGRMHRVDKFFHRVRPAPGMHMEMHRGNRNMLTHKGHNMYHMVWH